ncbi:MAG: hypothetical protein KH070_08235 [Clostridium sp.]|nr:hypothetical protein [Clostridium sp.]
MAEGFFRSKKGFTVVQNEITRDVDISLKAKGLYLVIQAYISMPDKKWTKEDFMRLAKEGKKAFDSAWKELKDFGYLKVHFMPDNGVWRAEYELLDEPDLGPHTLYHSYDGTVSSNNLTRAEKKRQADLSVEENKQVSLENISAPTAEKEENHRYTPFGTNGNNGYGTNANGGNNNKDYNIKPDIKTDLSNQYPDQDVDAMEEKYSMKFIEQHYELEPKYVSAPQEKSINTVKDVLYDVLNTQKPVLRVMGEDKPASVVKSRLLKLDRMDIDYAIEQYQKQVTKVHNHKAYMLTVLYQAKSQAELDISNRVMYDFYGAGRKVNGTGGGADG